MTELNFVEVNSQVIALTREPQKKLLQRKVVEDDHTAAVLHRIKDAGVITMVVPHVVNDCIELFESTQARALSAIIADFEAGREVTVHGMKAVNEKCDLGRFCQMRQKFFTVVADP